VGNRFKQTNKGINKLCYLFVSNVGIFSILGILLFCVLLTRFPKNCPWGRWLSLSGIALVFGMSTMHLIGLIYGGIPVVIWQYSGMLDLPALFCILTAVQSLTRLQYEYA
jgi:hypothetical protein